MTQHLRACAAATPNSATQVFASSAVLFRNLVTSTDVGSRATQGVNGPKSKDKVSSKSESKHVRRCGLNIIRKSRKIERNRVNEERNDQKDHDSECSAGAVECSWLSKPRELHSAHNLRHCYLSAAEGTPQRGMAESIGETVKEATLPLAGGRIKASTYVGLRQWR